VIFGMKTNIRLWGVKTIQQESSEKGDWPSSGEINSWF
jgi:hypothetical protein